ncbi:MAG: hypothetical protein AB7J32_07545 [Pseudonocardia sp.]
MSSDRSRPRPDSRLDMLLDVIMIGALVVMLTAIGVGLVMH